MEKKYTVQFNACVKDGILAHMELKITATMFFSLYSNNDLYLHVDWSDCYDTLKYSNKRCCSARIRERERFHIT